MWKLLLWFATGMGLFFAVLGVAAQPQEGIRQAAAQQGVRPPAASDQLSWELLAQVSPQPQGNTMVPVFPASLLRLNGQTVKLQGFMFPMVAGEKHTHFMLSARPASCPYCIPGSPDQMVEVFSTTPIAFGYDPIQVTGKLAILSNDPSGLFYRITAAKPG